MRYLILDTQDKTVPEVSTLGRVLTEKEALEVFRSIWKSGRLDGINMMMQNSKFPSPTVWDEVKKEL